MEPLVVDWAATLAKWKGAVGSFRLNLSDISRESGVTRQHVTSILAGTSVPSMPVAERIDRAIDAAVERRKVIAREATAGLKVLLDRGEIG